MEIKLKNIIFIIPAVFALLAGIYGALLRLGFPLPIFLYWYSRDHGALFICGFLGTLISLERAAALVKSWTYIAPSFSAFSAIFLVLNAPPMFAKISASLASFFLISLYLNILKKQISKASIVMTIAAFDWLIGNLFWLKGYSVKELGLWWISFLILTIAGERLELSRLLKTTKISNLIFLIIIILINAGATLSYSFPYFATKIYGISIIALSFWLVKNDIAKKSLKQKNLLKFISITLIVGFLWLGLGGLIILFKSFDSPYDYDAFLHSILLGFVFSMIFAHAPIMLPSLFSISINFTSLMYMPLILLHSSLIVRVVADLLNSFEGRKWIGLINVIAVLSYIMVIKTKAMK